MALIERFFAPTSEVKVDGLLEINLPRLGRFVALAGKNGSGKSRILNKLEWYVSARVNELPQVVGRQVQIATLENNILNNPNHPAIESWKNAIESEHQHLALTLERVVAFPDAPAFKAIRFVPKHLGLQDPRQLNSSQLIGTAEQAKNLGTDNIANTCLAYITRIQTQWWHTSHQGYAGSDETKAIALTEYQKLKDLIQQMLSTELTQNTDGIAMLFDKPISDAVLSDGQKIILQLCVALHAQKSGLDNTVFILDEPENHLHPSAAIDLLKRLYDVSSSSQIWIATHSIPLLAYIANIEPMSLWYVNEGAVTNAGKNPQIVLESLLGDEERIGQLNNFTGLPAQLAALNFASECLLPPQVVAYGNDDPQIKQIQAVINNLRGEASLAVLDYGAGKGRLLQGLAASLENSGSLISSSLDYYAYDEYETDQSTCANLISSIYDDGKLRCFNSADHFHSNKSDGSISLVVLCNVLHEIPANKWLTLFNESTLISRSLKDDGHLLIVEDQRIPIGEKAHEYGFLVLDTAQLRTLFGVADDDVLAKRFTSSDYRGDGRLKAHLIHKSLLSRVTVKTRSTAIEQLKIAAKVEIKKLQDKDPTYKNGQTYGFWTQQFANASLVLDDLGSH